LISADLERGASMRLNSVTVFPHAMAFAAGHDPEASRFEGEVTAKEARAVGIQWVFFPVADVNNNPDNPIINIRSFGEDPQEVSKFANAFIEGAQSGKTTRVLTTAKHFPGHGDTATDSHMRLVTIPADRARLDAIEFVPFRSAIAHGVDAVMTAHIAVPALDAPDMPATLSPKILTGILREEFGFKGLIVTDALEMGGISRGFKVGEAAVKALEAGADVLLMPSDPHAAIEGIVAAVNRGQIKRKRIQESVARILAAKARVGLGTRSLVDLEAIHEVINSPESNARAQVIAERAITLVRNEGAVVPLRDPAKTCFWALAESRESNEGQWFAPEVTKRSPASHIEMLDASMTDDDLRQAEQRSSACETNVVAAFVSSSAYRGDVSLAGNFPALLGRLIASRKPIALVSLGSPYLLRNFPDAQGYLATYSTVPPSEIAAVRALFGEIAIQGRLPVTIPNLAKLGDGIQMAPVVR
jgi:beta-N-acetylhexosaminidase